MKRGDEILQLISSYASKEGCLSEHLTKPGDFIVEELNHMKKAYDAIERECREIGDKGHIQFVSPLMWSHAEYGMALMMKTEKERESLGYVL